MPAHRPIFKPGGVSKTKGRTVSGLYFHHQRGWQRIVLPGAPAYYTPKIVNDNARCK